MWYDSTSLYGRRSGSENTGGLSVTCCLNIVKLSVWVLDHYRIISNVLLYVSASVEIIPHVQTQGPFLSFSAQGSSTLDVSPRCVNHQSEAEKLCWCSTASPRCIKRRLNTEVLCVYITFTFSFHQPKIKMYNVLNRLSQLEQTALTRQLKADELTPFVLWVFFCCCFPAVLNSLHPE